MTDKNQQGKPPKDRSPSFPFIPLQTAVERLVAFEQTFGRHPAPALKVGLAWKMKEASSQAGQTLAALKAFGLLDYHGAASERTATISEDGRTYLRAQQDSVRREVLKRAALAPKIIEKYWSVWGADRPPSAMCLDQLVLKGGFTQSAADTFLRVYDATISYAGLGENDTVGDTDLEEKDLEEPSPVGVGDTVQVEINGQLVLPKAARVRAIQHFEGKPWVYVDGSEAGIAMEQVRLEQKREGPGTGFVPPPLPLAEPERERLERTAKAGWKEERLIDDGGHETFLTYKGEPSVERYEFIRDYLDFRINRLKPKG